MKRNVLIANCIWVCHMIVIVKVLGLSDPESVECRCLCIRPEL